jgi:hypothetical protein
VQAQWPGRAHDDAVRSSAIKRRILGRDSGNERKRSCSENLYDKMSNVTGNRDLKSGIRDARMRSGGGEQNYPTL